MELLMGSMRPSEQTSKANEQKQQQKTPSEWYQEDLKKNKTSNNVWGTCHRWMASAPVLASSLESPSGLMMIYGCKEKQNSQIRQLHAPSLIHLQKKTRYLCFHSPCSCSGLRLPLSLLVLGHAKNISSLHCVEKESCVSGMCHILVVGTAVSVLLMVVVMVLSGVMIFLVQGWGVGGAKALSLLLGLLQDTAVGQSTEPAQELPIHLSDKKKVLCHTFAAGTDKISPASASHLSPAFFFAVKGALLFALLARLRRSVFLFRVGTTLALCPDKRGYDVTVLTGFGLHRDTRTLNNHRTGGVSKYKNWRQCYLLCQTVWHSGHTSCRLYWSYCGEPEELNKFKMWKNHGVLK